MCGVKVKVVGEKPPYCPELAKRRCFYCLGGCGQHMGDSTAIYARVSTREQSLEHQRENLWQYATEKLGFDPDNIEVLTDKSTGTNKDRSGYRQLMEKIEDESVDHVVVREVTRIGRDFRDIHDTVHTIVEDHNIGLYIQNDSLEIPADDEMSMQDKMFLSMLAWGAELEAKKLKENTIAGLKAARDAGKWTKRPPYGFTTDADGYLQPTEDFANARTAIYAVEELNWSHRKASRHTGVPRRTIPSLLERKELYYKQEHASEIGFEDDIEAAKEEEIQSAEEAKSKLDELKTEINKVESVLSESGE